MSLLNPVVTCGYVNTAYRPTLCYAHALLSVCILAVFFFFYAFRAFCRPVMWVFLRQQLQRETCFDIRLLTFGRQRLDCTNCSTVQWDVDMTLTNRPRPTLSCKDDQSSRVLDFMILTSWLDFGLMAVITTERNTNREQYRNHHGNYCNNKRKKIHSV